MTHDLYKIGGFSPHFVIIDIFKNSTFKVVYLTFKDLPVPILESHLMESDMAVSLHMATVYITDVNQGTNLRELLLEGV